QVDVVAITKLDRLARSVHHLVALGRELETLGVDLVVLDQTIETTTPSGRLLFHVLAAIAEFERGLIRDRVIAGLRRGKPQTRRGAGSTFAQDDASALIRATAATPRCRSPSYLPENIPPRTRAAPCAANHFSGINRPRPHQPSDGGRSPSSLC